LPRLPQSPAENTWNGPLVSYAVQYRQVQQQDWQEETVEFVQNQLLITNLAISQTYEVQVLAVNDKGRGPPSTPATIYVGEAGKCAQSFYAIFDNNNKKWQNLRKYFFHRI
jgi:hypothetical protein